MEGLLTFTLIFGVLMSMLEQDNVCLGAGEVK